MSKFIKSWLLASSVMLFSLSAFAQPANDDCAGTQTVQDNGNCVNGTTVGASDNWNGLIGCQGGNANADHEDVFYSFTATNSALTVDVTALAGWAGNIEITLLQPDPILGCAGLFTEIASNCGASPAQLTATGLIPGQTYYIIVSNHQNGTPGAFSICTQTTAPPSNCTDNDDCSTAEVITLGASGTPGSQTCINDCNTGAAPGIDGVGNNCYDAPGPTVWYEFTTDGGAATVDITLSSGNMADPTFTVWSDNCPVTTYYTTACGVSSVTNLQVTPNTTYYIAVTDGTNDEGTFTLCVNQNLDQSLCNVGDDLVEVSSSDPLTPVGGPYSPGETVSFCYNINQYMKENCNWLQGIVPTFGDCWDPASFNAQGMPITSTPPTQAGGAAGTWSWWPAGAVLYNNLGGSGSLPPGTPVGAGWFFVCTGCGAGNNGPTPNDSYGDGYDNGGGPNGGQCNLNGNGFTWQVCFTLIAGPSTNCANGFTDCGVDIKTYADAEIGSYPALGCAGDQAFQFDAQFQCCPIFNPVNDVTVCDSYQFPTIGGILLTGNESYYTGPGGTGTQYSGGDIVNFGTFPSYPQTIYIYDPTSCAIEISFQLTIGQTPTVTLSPLADVCINAGVQTGLGGGLPTGGVYSGTGVTDNGNGTTFSFDPLVAGSGSTTITYTVVTLPNPPGCSSFATQTITVNPQPTISGNAPICIGATVQLNGSGTPNGTTPWASSNPGVATVSNTGLVTGVSAGTSTITYMDINGCTNTVVVTVNPTPTISGNAPICIGATVQLTGSGTPNGSTPWTSSNPAVATVSVTGLVTGVSAGTSTITYMDNAGCTNTVIVTVNPTPTISGNAPICIGATVQLTGSGTPNGSTPWASSNPGVATVSNTGLVTGVSGGTTTITYMDVNGCTNTVIVTVNPTPTISGNTPICIGSTVQLTGSGTPNGTTPWVSSNPGVATISNTGLVTGVSGGTTTITYMDVNGCTNTVIVTVNPIPTISGNTPICIGATVQLTGSGTPNATTPWTSSNPGVATVSNTGLVTGVSAGTSTITYMDVNGCTNTVIVTVNPTPTISGNAPICIGATVQLTGSGTPNATTPWTSSNPGVATISNTGLVTGVSAGTSTITYMDVNGCTNTVIVTVNPTPTISGNAPICIGSTVQLTGSGTPNATTPWTSSNPGVATVGTTGLVTGVSAGTSTITYMDNAGCSNTVIVTVNGLPLINTAQTPLTGCNTNDGIITVSDAGGATGTVIWTGPSGGNSGVVTLPFNITGLAPGTYNVTFTDNTTGCTSTASQQTLTNPGAPVVNPFAPVVQCGGSYQVDYNNITGTLTGGQAFYSASGGNIANQIPNGTVYSAPITITIWAFDENGACSSEEPLSITLNPIPTITGNTPICIGSTVQLTGSGTPNGSTPWSSSNPGVATVSVTGLVTGVSGGTTTITYMDANGCSNTEIVTVNPTPTISGNTPICIGATVQLTGSGTPNGTTPWTSSNPGVATISNTGLVTGVSGGTTTITYMDVNGCTNTVIVTVNPTPTISGNAPICIGATVQLTGSGTPNGTTPWISSNPGVATISNTGLVTGVSGGTTTITYMDANGCSNTEIVTVNPTPTISGNAPICIGATVQLTGSGTPNATTPWTSSNPAVATISNTGLVTGVSAGTSTITYMDVNGCSNTEIVTVNPTPTISGNAPICIGATVQLTGSGTPNATTPWASSNPGVATVNNTGLVTGVSGGTTTITYMDDAGCTNTEIVTVNPTPTISGNAPLCIGATVQLTGSGTPNGFTPWTSSNPAVATVSVAGLVTAISAGTSTITYMDNAGCTNTVIVTVNPTPTISGNAPICIGTTVQLAGSGTPNATTPWTSSNPAVATINNTGLVTGVSAGTTTITYMDANGCSNTEIVTVNPTPTISGNTPICIGSTVQLTGSGTPNATTPWVSSNPAVATISNTGLVTGVSAGTTTITYMDANGCTNTEIVTVNPTPTITGNAPICAGATVQLTGSGTPNATTPWTSSNPAVATISNTGLVTGVSGGTTDITYTDINGCQVTEVVTVNALPAVNPTTATPSICEGEDIVLLGNAVAGATYSWTGPNAFTSTVQNPIITAATAAASGTYSLTITSNGCSNTATVIITVVTGPVITPQPDVTACESFDLPLITGTNLSGNQAYYNDSQLNGGTVITGPITSSQTVWIYDAVAQCSNETSFIVTINPLPNVVGVNGEGTYCQGDVVGDIFVDVTGSANWTIDYTLDGTAMTATGAASPVSLGNIPGVYVLTGITDANCSNSASGTQTIVVNPVPGAPTAGTDAEYCSTVEFDQMTASGNGGIFNWYTDAGLTSPVGSGSTLVPINQTGQTTYYVTETLNGCTGQASMVIITVKECDIVVPTAFTPDDDGTNDDWVILNLDNAYPNSKVFVYNRWGNQIFESIEGDYDSNRWDGKYNGTELPVGSYYFIIKFNEEGVEDKTGTVSIIKNK